MLKNMWAKLGQNLGKTWAKLGQSEKIEKKFVEKILKNAQKTGFAHFLPTFCPLFAHFLGSLKPR